MPHGDWFPANKKHLEIFLKELVKRIYGIEDGNEAAKIEERDGDKICPLHEEVLKLWEKIETDSKYNLYFNGIFLEVPTQYMNTMTIKNYKMMLRAINYIMSMPPVYTKHHVGCPINAILTWPMGTVSGYAAFLDDDVNVYIGAILRKWKEFLQSPYSTKWLNKDPNYGWFGLKAMPDGTKEFEITYKCDPSKENFGFESWDAYFIREFRDGVRPVESPDDNTIIVNACESAPYNLAFDVKARDEFWLKAQKYSIIFMLNNDPLARLFVGGTVYQAFLSNLNYHRWHSPVDGTVRKVVNVPGGFYTESRAMGYDDEGDNRSQGYLTETQTRMLIFIDADNADIGLMCFIGVGMGDVSSNESFVTENQRVTKGEMIGTFHIGGSTHCLCFRRGVKLEFDLRGQTPGLNSNIIHLNEKIATVFPSTEPAQLQCSVCSRDQ